MTTEPQQQKILNDQPSPDYVSLKEFLSVFAKIITALVGFGALYLLFGYSIILSYISTIKLYGLTSFTSDFYKEAAINFMKNMLETYGDHLPFTYSIILILSVLFVSFNKYGQKLAIYRTYLEGVLLVFTLIVILSTLRLGYLYDDFYKIHHAKELFLFDISFPFLLLLVYYLATNFKSFYAKPYTFYYIISLLTITLYFTIPVSYGDNIFDIVVYPIVGLEANADAKLESIADLQKNVNKPGPIPLFYFMGYATDKIILLDNQTLSTPAKMIMLNKDSIKYISISNNFKNTLRNMVRYQKYHKIDPVPQPGSRLAFQIMSGNSFKNDKSDVVPDPSLALVLPGQGIGKIQLGDSVDATVRKMNKAPSMARKILYPDTVEYWLNYEDLGLAFIFDSASKLSKIAINNPTMVLNNYNIRVKSPLSDLYDTFGKGKEIKHEEGLKLVTYEAAGVSFTVSPKEGKILTITVFKKAPTPPGPRPLVALKRN